MCRAEEPEINAIYLRKGRPAVLPRRRNPRERATRHLTAESSTHRIIGGAHKAVAPIAYGLEIRVPGITNQACDRWR